MFIDKKVLIGGAVLVLGLLAFAMMRGPSTYNECVAGYVDQIHSRSAAVAVANRCRELFPAVR